MGVYVINYIHPLYSLYDIFYILQIGRTVWVFTPMTPSVTQRSSRWRQNLHFLEITWLLMTCLSWRHAFSVSLYKKYSYLKIVSAKCPLNLRHRWDIAVKGDQLNAHSDVPQSKLLILNEINSNFRLELNICNSVNICI